MASTAPPPALLPKGGWVTGTFEGPYEALLHKERPSALIDDARVHDLTLLPGHVKGLRRARAPRFVAGGRAPLSQARLEVLAELDAEVPRAPAPPGAPASTALPVVHRLVLRDVFLCDWSAEPLLDELAASRGLVRGVLYGRVGPEPWSWWRWLWLLLLLLVLLAVLLLFARCGPLEPVVGPLRQRVIASADDLRWRVVEGFGHDADAALVAEATRGTGGGPPLGAGAGGAGGAGAGGAGAGGAGAGGAGAGGAGAGGAGGAGAGGAGGAGAGGAGAGGAGGAGAGGAGAGDGSTGGVGPRRYSVDEALDDPASFFSKCGRPLYLSGDLLFDLDQHTLRPDSVPLLRRLVRLLKASPADGRILVVAGHADPQGESAHNEELSQRRAETVAAFIAEHGGVGKNTLVVEGRGEREPIVPAGAPVEQQRFNRRVEISVRCPGGAP